MQIFSYIQRNTRTLSGRHHAQSDDPKLSGKPYPKLQPWAPNRKHETLNPKPKTEEQHPRR